MRYSDGYLTGSPGPLSSGGCGRASPVVPGGKSPLVCLISTRWMVVANAAIIATARTAAKIAKVICVRRRLLQLRSLFMGNTLSNMNQRNPLEPVPLLPPSSSDLSRLHLARPRPQSSAANIYPPPPPAKIRSHPHRVVAIIVRDRPHRHRGRRSRTRRSCGSGDGGSLQARLQYSGPPFAVDNSSDYAWVITMQPTSADEHQRPDDVGGDPADMAFPKSDDRLIRQLRDLADLR